VKGEQTIASQPPAREWLRSNLTTVGPVILTIVIIAVFQVINPAFLSYNGVITLVYAMSYFLIAACGLTFVIMTGSFDFSVISILKLAALLSVLYVDQLASSTGYWSPSSKSPLSWRRSGFPSSSRA
jgi:ribose/xylose/arabinose/galactoside ABC-type transport system permease subunit